MAISNNSTGLRTGVCTSTTRPTAPYEGQMIFETDTNRVLVWDNDAWVMIADTDSPPAMQLVKPTSVTGGTIVGSSIAVGTAVSSVVISGAFSAEFDAYKIVYTGGLASAGVNLQTRLGSTTTGYRSVMNGVSSASAAVQAYDNNTNTSWIWTGGASTTYCNYSVEIRQPFLSCPTFCENTLITNAADNYWNVRGSLADSNSYTAITIFPSSGTITGGTIAIYGYRK